MEGGTPKDLRLDTDSTDTPLPRDPDTGPSPHPRKSGSLGAKEWRGKRSSLVSTGALTLPVGHSTKADEPTETEKW